MAQLQLETDLYQPGRWIIRSDNLSVIAAVPDAVSQVLDLSGEALAAWALHPDEQAGMRDAAYHDELREVGVGPLVEVRELVRPWQPNVVWVDRYHLLVAAAPTTIGSRLLGLYAGSKGRIVIAVYHPSVAGVIQQVITEMPNGNAADWNRDDVVAQCRFILRYDPETPNAIQLRAPQPMAMGVQDSLTRLTQMVAGW